MKISGLSLLLFAEAAIAASLGSRSSVDKRQFSGIFGALIAGDTSILGALGSMSIYYCTGL
jgi:hypothetical protein